MKTFIIPILIIFLVSSHTDCQSFSKIYGNSNNNIASVVKQFDNGIFVAGLNETDSLRATISKFSLSGAILWEKVLPFSSEIMDFDYDPSLFNGAGGLIIVGRTLPLSVSGAPQDNKSFIFEVEAITGIIGPSRLFDQRGRESFNKIIRHPFPINVASPYYVLGSNNVLSNPSPPSTVENVVLLNFTSSLTTTFFEQYSGPPTTSSDMEFFRGLIPLRGGDLLLTGNNVPNGFGALVKVSGLSGAKLYSTSYNKVFDILDGIELLSGDIMVVGEYFNNTKSNAFIGIITYDAPLNSYYFKNVTGFAFSEITKFKEIWNNGSTFYVSGQNQLGAPINQAYNLIVELKYNSTINDFTFSDFKYIYESSENENSISEGSICFSNTTNQIYLIESKNSNSTFGNKDIFLESTTTQYNNIQCIDSETYKLGTLIIDNNNLPVFQSHMNMVSSSFTLNNLNYNIKTHCKECNLLIRINPIINCYNVQFNTTVTQGTSPFTFSWDINCDGGAADYTTQNPVHQFPGPGTYNICVTVTDNSLPLPHCVTTSTIQVNIPLENTAPVIMCPPSITISTDFDKCTAKNNSIVTATDNCDQQPTISCIASGATIGNLIGGSLIYNTGVTTVTCIASDDSGNQSQSCIFTVTVNDTQKPTIDCPQDQTYTIPFCESPKIVIFPDPIVSDNCPTPKVSCSKRSGDKFPCGITNIICTAKDLAGNLSTCNFQININCECLSATPDSFNCGILPNSYNFTIHLINASGSGLPCIVVPVLNPLQGTISNYTVNWDVPLNQTGYISGTIISTTPIPSEFNISVNATCTCSNGQTMNCTDNVSFNPKCCLEAILIDNEICKHDNEYAIPIIVEGGPYNITQVKWYIKPYPCDGNYNGVLYQESNLTSTLVYPVNLSDNILYINGFCMYAVVSVSDFPCTEIFSNIAHYKFCDYVKCTINSSQEYCFTGNPIVPNILNLSVDATSCTSSIDWIDALGNIIPGQTNQLTYQPPPLTFTLSNEECKQIYKYGVQVSSPCGIETCYSEIIINNNDAPVGEITMNPIENQPFCPGEDATISFLPHCPITPPQVQWSWLYRQTIGTSGLNTPLTGAGNMNPQLHTNRLWEDTWYIVETQNGNCPAKQIEYLIDVRDKIKITNFTALSLNICKNSGVLLNLEYTPTDCSVNITWYKDGLPIFSTNYSSSPASYTYINPLLNGHYGGNYYAIVKSNCCENQIIKSDIKIIQPPMELVLGAPCYCSDGTIGLNVEVVNPIGNSSLCTIQWYEIIGGIEIIIPGASTTTLEHTCGGEFIVKVNCNGCAIQASVNVKKCNCLTAADDLQDISAVNIYPNPTNDELNVNITGKNIRLTTTIDLLNISGQILNQQLAIGVNETYRFSVSNLPTGLYYIRLKSIEGYYIYKRFVKI